MAFILKDRVKQNTTTAGSGDLSFTATPSGYVSFSSVFNSGDLTYYCIENGFAWEVGIGRYLDNSLSREVVLSSSTGSKLSLSGKSTVFVTLPATGIVRFDESGESNLPISSLSDVSTSALNSGDLLTYNGSTWENKPQQPSYTDEQAQDAVGNIFVDTPSVSISYSDSTPSISANVKDSGITDQMLYGGINAVKIGSGLVDNIEFGYLNGVTSSIQDQINSKASSGHQHTSNDITNFSEAVDDRVSSLLSAGSGVQLTYNDSGNLLSVDVYGILPTGGSAGQILSKIDGINYNTEWIDNYAKEIVQYVKNSTQTTLNKGQVVYINGADGTNPTISLSIASGESTSSKTIGFLKQGLANGEFGYVVTEGFLDGLDTSSANADGDPMWLSPTISGGVVYGLANKPHAPNHMVFLGYVIRKNVNNGRIYVKIQNGFELDELHNVSATGAVNGDVLVYNSGNRLWESKSSSTLYNDENAQDAVGGILANTSSISISYDDGTPSISANVRDSGIVNSMVSSGIDASKIASGLVNNTEFGYLSGVTSSIQNQLNSKSNSGHQHLSTDITDFTEASQDSIGNILANTSSVNLSYDDNAPSISASIPDSGITNSMLFGSIDATKIGSGLIDNVEFNYLDGVSSGIQPQLDLKVPTSRTITINGIGFDLSQDRSYTIPSGVTNLNGLTDTSQTFVASSGGADFAIQSSGNVHTFLLPNASATARGVVSTGVQTIAGAKTFNGVATFNGVGSNAVVVSGNMSCNLLNGSVNAYTVAANAGRCTMFNHFNVGGGFGYGFTVGTGVANPPSVLIIPIENTAANLGRISFNYGTNPCGLFINNTYTSATSFERLAMNWSLVSSVSTFTIETQAGSGGGVLRGIRFGSSNSQLMSFWGATPITQPTTSVASAIRVAGSGNTITDADTIDGYTILQVVKALRNFGVLA